MISQTFSEAQNEIIIKLEKLACTDTDWHKLLEHLDIIYYNAVHYNAFMEEINISPRLLTMKQAKEYLNCGINTIYQLGRDNKIPIVKIGNKQFVDKNKLDEILNKGDDL